MKAAVTLMACVTAMAMIGFGLYSFAHEIKNWGGPLLAGMACGFITMCAAYNAK